MQKIDFAAINSAALQQFEQLLLDWLPGGKVEGREYKALNPTRSDNRAGSFSINIDTGVWADFAGGDDDRGSDPVSLYAYLFTRGSQKDAAIELGPKLGIDVEGRSGGEARPNARPQSPPASASDKKKRSPWVPQLPAPADAPEAPIAHVRRGHPEKRWQYRDAGGATLGYVYRFRTSDGGKDVLPACWAVNEKTGKGDWRWMAFAEPRPLYGLDRLAAAPDAPVLMVEGEKCADAGTEHLADYVTVSWPGGSKAIGKVGFSPLAGRTVYLWPDCDAQVDKLTGTVLPEREQPGVKAMVAIAQRLLDLGCTVYLLRIPAPGEKPGSWDIADAIEDGTDAAAFIIDNARPYQPDGAPTATGAGAGGGEKWTDALLWRRGELVACLANIIDIISNTREWRGVLAYDEFAQRTVKLKPPPYAQATIGEWESLDDSQTAMWLTRRWGLVASSATVAEAIEVLARMNTFHPVRQWLNGLPEWDGVVRTSTWLHTYLGVPVSEYSKRVGMWYLLGMVNRVMRPGSKFDYCLVLEGKQGRKKSAVFAVLGGEWYGDTDLDLGNKDSMTALRGKMLYEFAELGSLAKAESLKQKSFLSRQVDEYRPVYGRREIRAPRQVVFGGTTNDWEWNKDPTGGRRFWPVEVGEVLDIEGLTAVRDQLFAEAYARYKKGQRYWPEQKEQEEWFDPEQLKREQPDGIVDYLHDWVYSITFDFSIADAITLGLKQDSSKITRQLETRVGIALRKLGCTKVEKRNGSIRYWYKPPTRKAATSTTEQPGPEVGDDPFAEHS